MDQKKFDYETDFKNELHFIFSDLGLKIPIKKKLDEMLLDYLTILKKLIPAKAREVLISPDLILKLELHPKQKEVEVIKNLFAKGGNVNYFQSKKLFQTNFHDHLLYEWNIYHFHLSLEREKKSNFIKQTNQLLFAYIDDERVIFLDIENHKAGIFADVKWLEILDNYFPEVIEPYRSHDIVDVLPKVNAIERQTLWNKGYLLGMTKVNNKVIHSPGIGRATSGHSVLVTKTVYEILRWLFELEKQIENNFALICNIFDLDKDVTEFKVRIGDITIELFEKHSNRTILIYRDIFDFS